MQARRGALEALLPDEIRRNSTRTRIVVPWDNAVPYGQDVRFSRGRPRATAPYGDGALSVRRADLEAALAEGRAHRVP